MSVKQAEAVAAFLGLPHGQYQLSTNYAGITLNGAYALEGEDDILTECNISYKFNTTRLGAINYWKELECRTTAKSLVSIVPSAYCGAPVIPCAPSLIEIALILTAFGYDTDRRIPLKEDEVERLKKNLHEPPRDTAAPNKDNVPVDFGYMLANDPTYGLISFIVLVASGLSAGEIAAKPSDQK